MDLHLAGTRAIITGGSAGIGLAIAHRLAEEGTHVGLVARDATRLAAAREDLAHHGTHVATHTADVTNIAELVAAVDALAGELRGLDHVVANAGGTVGGAVLGAAPDEVAASIADTPATSARL